MISSFCFSLLIFGLIYIYLSLVDYKTTLYFPLNIFILFLLVSPLFITSLPILVFATILFGIYITIYPYFINSSSFIFFNDLFFFIFYIFFLIKNINII